MITLREGRKFDVVDDPQTRAWSFWEEHFPYGWERHTLAALDRLLVPERDYLDIGAWVGPTVIWGAPLARRCVAVEPDPVALDVLKENVARNCTNVTIIEAAAAEEHGTAELETGGTWGDSMSSLQRRSPSTQVVSVPTVPLTSLLEDLNPAVVKIDIEGGEALLLPPNEAVLHDLGCSIVLSIHWPWMSDSQAEDVVDFVSGFNVTTLDDNPQFPTLVLR